MNFDINTGRPISRVCRDSDPIISYVGERYFNVWDFMICDFKLERTELLVYAIIFSMYKSTGKYFTGSKEYLAKWSGACTRSVASALKSLEKKRYIDTLYKTVDGKKRAVYYVNLEMLPTCKAFSRENFARDVWQKYVAEQERLGNHVEKQDMYAAMEKVYNELQTKEGRMKLANNYVKQRDMKKQTSTSLYVSTITSPEGILPNTDAPRA